MAADKPSGRVEVFISYSHLDKKLKDKLEAHLTFLGDGRAVWSDARILPGDRLDPKIEKHLNRADLFLLLVSANYWKSRYCQLEMKRALERRDAGETVVIPVILNPCGWQNTTLGALKALPEDGKAITTKRWANQDEACADVEKGVRAAIKEVEKRKTSAPSTFAGNSVWNVPVAKNLHFTGRVKELADMEKGLASGGPVALTQAVHGLGGVGKTQLAAEFCWRHRGEYPVVWWIRSEDPATLAGDFAGLATALGLPEAQTPDQGAVIAAVKRWLEANTGWLLVFDNVEIPEDVKPFLPQAAHARVIVTSRNPNWKALAASLPVEVLPEANAIAFLLGRTGRTDKDGAKALANELGGLPLALAQAAAYVDETAISFPDYVKLFQTRRNELWKNQKPPDDYRYTTDATFSIAIDRVQAMNPAAIDLLNLCAFFAPDDIPKQMIVVAAKELPDALAATVKNPLAFNEAIAALRKVSLIDAKEHTFSVHRLVQAVVRHRLSDEDRKSWVSAAVRIVNSVLPEESEDVLFWPMCAILLPHGTTVADHAMSIDTDVRAARRIFNQLGNYLKGRAAFDGARVLYEQALMIAEKIFEPNDPEIAISFHNLGSVLVYLRDRDMAKSYIERALDIFEKTLGPDDPHVAVSLNNLGDLLRDTGDLKEARHHLERALTIDEKTLRPNDAGLGIRLSNLGTILRRLGDRDGAQALHERAILIFNVAYGPEHPTVAIGLNNLGTVLSDRGDLDAARDLYRRAINIKQKFFGNNHPEVQKSLRNLALVENKIAARDAAKKGKFKPKAKPKPNPKRGKK